MFFFHDFFHSLFLFCNSCFHLSLFISFFFSNFFLLSFEKTLLALPILLWSLLVFSVFLWALFFQLSFFNLLFFELFFLLVTLFVSLFIFLKKKTIVFVSSLFSLSFALLFVVYSFFSKLVSFGVVLTKIIVFSVLLSPFFFCITVFFCICFFQK